jgi:hypothetical protein
MAITIPGIMGMAIPIGDGDTTTAVVTMATMAGIGPITIMDDTLTTA